MRQQTSANQQFQLTPFLPYWTQSNVLLLQSSKSKIKVN
jgi:hypothetical protein